MCVSDCFGELVVAGDFGLRWKCLYISVVLFLYSVYELLIGLLVATNSETGAKQYVVGLVEFLVLSLAPRVWGALRAPGILVHTVIDARPGSPPTASPTSPPCASLSRRGL